MTDPLDPLDPLDLEASTALDDDRPGDGPAARSSEVAQRMEAFGRVRAAVGAPVDPPPAEAREAAVAAALGAFDAGDGEDGRDPATPGISVVTPLRRSRPGGRWLGAAAAAAVLVLGVAVVLTGGLGGPDQDETAATADEAAELDAADADAEVLAPGPRPDQFLDDADAETEAEVGTTSGSVAAGGDGGAVDLGAHDDVEGLVRSLDGQVEEARRSAPPATTTPDGLASESADQSAGDACAETRSTLEAEGPILLEGDALVAGALVRVLVVDARTSGDTDAPVARPEVVVADPGGVGCPVLARVPLG